MTRFVLGVLLCALAYPGAILVLASEHWAAGTSAFIAGVFTVAGSVLLALLILAVFRRRGWLRWWQLVAGGALIGGILPFFRSRFLERPLILERRLTSDSLCSCLPGSPPWARFTRWRSGPSQSWATPGVALTPGHA